MSTPTPHTPASSHPRTRIAGWGADLDPADRPAVPKERTPPRLEGVHWDEPEQQPRTIEVLVSPEHEGLTPVFGTSVPPRGLSGAMRRRAFRHSENDLRHWLMLMAADRVDVLEGRLEDVRAHPVGRRLTHPAVLGGVALLGVALLARRLARR